MQNITALETVGQFPKRIRLGPGRQVWSQLEIIDWMQSKIDRRKTGPLSPRVVIGPDDRFIGKKELRALVSYSPQYVRVLEMEGTFPGRIRIGSNRVAWLEREILDWIEAARLRGGSAAESNRA